MDYDYYFLDKCFGAFVLNITFRSCQQSADGIDRHTALDESRASSFQLLKT